VKKTKIITIAIISLAALFAVLILLNLLIPEKAKVPKQAQGNQAMPAANPGGSGRGAPPEGSGRPDNANAPANADGSQRGANAEEQAEAHRPKALADPITPTLQLTLMVRKEAQTPMQALKAAAQEGRRRFFT